MKLINYVVGLIGVALLIIGIIATALIALGAEPKNPLAVPLILVSGIALLLLAYLRDDPGPIK